MPVFTVEVVDYKGNFIKEKVEGVSMEQVRAQMLAQGKSVTRVMKPGEIDLAFIEEFFAKVTVKDMAIFSRQFAAMVNAGVAIVRCLGVLSEQCPNAKLKKALTVISADVQQGISLSESMGKHPQVFDNLYVSMVEAGEMGGVLDDVLSRLAKLLEDMAKLANQIKSAATYPIAVGSLAVIVFFAMTIFLIPIFANIFADLGVELPLLTQIMLFLSEVFRTPQFIIGAPLTVFALKTAYAQLYKTEWGHYHIDLLFLKLPLIGDLNEKNAVARFCRIFGTLTRSGVPIMSTFDIVGATAGNQVISEAIDGAKGEIQEGGLMSQALNKAGVFPDLAIQMISIGEETGELDGMMMKVADFYEDEVENTVKALTSIIEPVMMIGIAGIVAVILLSMYLPMFKVFETMG